jgi:hypothetical protein
MKEGSHLNMLSFDGAANDTLLKDSNTQLTTKLTFCKKSPHSVTKLVFVLRMRVTLHTERSTVF